MVRGDERGAGEAPLSAAAVQAAAKARTAWEKEIHDLFTPNAEQPYALALREAIVAYFTSPDFRHDIILLDPRERIDWGGYGVLNENVRTIDELINAGKEEVEKRMRVQAAHELRVDGLTTTSLETIALYDPTMRKYAKLHKTQFGAVGFGPTRVRQLAYLISAEITSAWSLLAASTSAVSPIWQTWSGSARHSSSASTTVPCPRRAATISAVSPPESSSSTYSLDPPLRNPSIKTWVMAELA